MAKYYRPERTIEDMNKICGDAFKKLEIPKYWKFKEYDRTRLSENEESEIQSITALFTDTRTSRFNLKEYRINFHTYSERMSIVEVTYKDYGRPAPCCLASNMTAEELNKIIASAANKQEEEPKK